MRTLFRLLVAAAVLAGPAGCTSPTAQGNRDVEALQKDIEALEAQQQEIQRSLDEVREFLRAATGGRFGAPPIVGSRFDTAGAPSNGQAAAPVTIVEISDYHCPFCRRHVQQTQPQIYADYVKTGRARHVFIHYPIAQLHPDAHKSHEAAGCAADQGKFWEMHARLFDAAARTADQILGLAQGVGLDMTAFRACLESGRHAKAVSESVERVQKLAINGTPFFLIGRTPADGSEAVTVAKIVEGAQPYQAFKTAIEDVLATKD